MHGCDFSQDQLDYSASFIASYLSANTSILYFIKNVCILMVRNTLECSPEQNINLLEGQKKKLLYFSGNSNLMQAVFALIHSEAVMVYLVCDLL